MNLLTHTTMKKTYIIPNLLVIKLDIEQTVATSFEVNANKYADQQYVKDAGSTAPSYNVWNDDWSE